MSEWKKVKFEDIALLSGENVQPADARGLPYIGLEHIGESSLSLIGFGKADQVMSTKKRFTRGDILFGKLRPYFRKLIRAPFDGVCSTDIWVIRSKDISNIDYLFYLMASDLFIEPVVRSSQGTRMPRAIWEFVSSLEFPLPPLSEQKAIAHILGSLDDKIELNRRMNETLEAMARAIFKNWFVDFEPTRAKIEGRAPYLPEPIWSLFPDEIDPLSGLPIGWKLGNLGSISESVNRIVNPVEIDAQTPYIGLEHIPRCSISLSNWGSAGKVTSNKLRFEKREFLFGKLRPYFHKVGIAPISGICSTDIVVIRAKSEIWSSFVLEVISSDDFIEYTNLTSTGTKMPRTSWIIMGKYELALPSEAFVKHFNLTIQPCMSQIIDNIHQSRTLAELRDRLLPKLMSGQIRVKDAEKLVEEVL